MSSFVDYSKTSNTQIAINFHQKIIVDYFAGGGGASTGLAGFDVAFSLILGAITARYVQNSSKLFLSKATR